MDIEELTTQIRTLLTTRGVGEFLLTDRELRLIILTAYIAGQAESSRHLSLALPSSGAVTPNSVE